jgi:hypothetical protein
MYPGIWTSTDVTPPALHAGYPTSHQDFQLQAEITLADGTSALPARYDMTLTDMKTTPASGKIPADSRTSTQTLM